MNSAATVHEQYWYSTWTVIFVSYTVNSCDFIVYALKKKNPKMLNADAQSKRVLSSLLVILWMRLHFRLIFFFFFFLVLNKMGMGWSTVLPYQCLAIIASTLDEKQMSEGLKIGIKVASAFLDELSHNHWVWSEPSLKSIMSIDKTFVINLEMVKL